MMPWEIVAWHPVYKMFTKALATDQMIVTNIGSYPMAVLPEIPLILKARTANVLPNVWESRPYNPW